MVIYRLIIHLIIQFASIKMNRYHTFAKVYLFLNAQTVHGEPKKWIILNNSQNEKKTNSVLFYFIINNH